MTKKLIGLTATSVEEVAPALYRPVPMVMDEPVAGYHRQVSLTAEGLMVVHANERILFPLAELLRLAEAQMTSRPGEPVIT